MAGTKRVTREIFEEQDDIVTDICEAHARRSAVVLFPTEDDKDVTRFMAERRECLGFAAARATPQCVDVLDRTGRQARNSDNFMPDEIPRVKMSIDDEFRSDFWLNPVRLRTEAHRLCSAQAAASVLKILGETAVTAAVEDTVRLVVGDLARERSGVNGGVGSVFS